MTPPLTPALVVRRSALMRNLAAMQARCDAAGVALRAHGKMHKCSEVGRLQVAGGAVGLCCQTVGEAEAFAAAGIDDLLVTAPIAPWGAARLAALVATGVRISVVSDDDAQVDRLAEAARAADVVLNVVVDVDLGLHRAGCPPTEAVALARRIATSNALRFDGVQAYLGHLQHLADLDARRSANEAATAILAALVDSLNAEGLSPARVTGGGTGTFAYDLAAGVFTELQAGSYAFMDAEYDGCGAPDGEPWPFEPALFIAASIVSAQHKTHVTNDAGLKAVAVDGPPAKVVAGAPEGSRWFSMGDEHGGIAHPATFQQFAAAARDALTRDRTITVIDSDPAVPWPADAPKSGDLVWLQPGHCDPTVNLYDAIFVADEDGTLERWPIDARRVSG
ncbi:alanine racemase [Sphingoaurantiacus capsulatus]|uniref:alanine racemase n=1 Tax=Sphingoaurantiacus capsulatus TaxID=1771310 RepID=UPI0036D225A1